MLATAPSIDLSAAEATPPPQQPDIHVFSFQGTGTALFALVMKNMMLTLLTLGVYMPWAKTERRKFLWQNVEIAGHRLRYHGTGKELFKGYLKVVLAYVLVALVSVMSDRMFGKAAGNWVRLGLVLVILPLIPYAIWGSNRYLLSRTSWRGVHFRLEGGAGKYAKTFFSGFFLTLVTLGLYSAVMTNRLYRGATNHTGLGTKSFEYRGRDLAVFKLAMKGLGLSIVTFGLYSFWYNAAIARYRLENTWFDGAHGELRMSGADLFGLWLLQVFGLTLTLGLAFPWITTYTLRFVLERMRFVGPIDFEHIYRAETQGNATADGLADALDVGSAL
jgi:uncharacterized membrane protein YjgN (DUF898 family)